MSLTPDGKKDQLRASVSAGRCVPPPEGGNGVAWVSAVVWPVRGASPAPSRGWRWESSENCPPVVHRLVTDVPCLESCRVGKDPPP